MSNTNSKLNNVYMEGGMVLNRSCLKREELKWKATFRVTTGLPPSIISEVYEEVMVKRK